MAERRYEAEPEATERSLVTLVLTVVELLRQLMEKQALRRVDQGDFTRRPGRGDRPDADAAAGTGIARGAGCAGTDGIDWLEILTQLVLGVSAAAAVFGKRRRGLMH
ncbi:hypothetical protein HNR02_006527 [Amycolatopsis endophytica]|uniref:Uncharacterized protein n=1 Tax=Amycolatopsis endophytica TaxID=860233 RepID=A0A853BEQ1_9PSEU|nr:gas vesicle protein GvpK [Amycolatopsis endophytica]NYI93152.1 hypothetical protein [Amycolatopsis endophytica]